MKLNKKIMVSALAATLLTLGMSGCGSSGSDNNENPNPTEGSPGTTNPGDTSNPALPTSLTQEQKSATLKTYADIAEQNYEDALADAQALQSAIDAFVATPTEATLSAAKEAWLASRESYGTTEIFRLSGGPIDAEDGWVATMYGAPEGQMNAWPLDENMIDYTTDADGNTTSGNIIDTAGVFTPNGGDAVDVASITTEALAALNENGGDANVATGYHAIEFLLWGQDQDYSSFVADTVTNGAQVAGQRALTDFTSDAGADRRKAYLVAAAELLVDDLQAVVDAWQSENTPNCTTGVGCYRGALLGTLSGDDAAKNIATDDALKSIFGGMGVFIKSELANERMAVAVLTPSEEDEHSCFSDNTHRDIATNYQGFVNVLKGEYKGVSQGTSFYSLLESTKKSTLDTLISTIDTKVEAIDTVAKAQNGYHFDYQIVSGRTFDEIDTAQNIVSAKNYMRDLGDEMVSVAEAFGISLSEEDVTDPEETQL